MLESFCNKVADLQICNVIKKRLQHRCFPVNIAKSLRTPILKIIWKRLLLPLEVFCIRTLLILAMRMLHLASKRLYSCSLSIFLTTIAFGLMKYLFRIDGNNLRALVKYFTLCSIYRSNQPYGKFTELHKLISIVLQLTNQLK